MKSWHLFSLKSSYKPSQDSPTHWKFYPSSPITPLYASNAFEVHQPEWRYQKEVNCGFRPQSQRNSVGWLPQRCWWTLKCQVWGMKSSKEDCITRQCMPLHRWKHPCSPWVAGQVGCRDWYVHCPASFCDNEIGSSSFRGLTLCAILHRT